MSTFDRVKEFMRRFGQHMPTPFVPTVSPDSVVRQRCAWQLEESVSELLAACYDLDARHHHYTAQTYRAALESHVAAIQALIDRAPVKVDLVAYADANADIRYVAYGNDVAAGIDGDETDIEVCASNDSKSAPDEPGGKVRKDGPHYKPPRIAALLEELGWRR